MITRLLIILAFSSAIYAQDPGPYHGPGFSLTPPSFDASGSGQVAMFFLPPTGAFAANVNVQIQDFPGTLAEYDQVTRAQCSQAGLKILKADIQSTFIDYEYTGARGGNHLHWVARALSRGGKIYLVTGTCLESKDTLQIESLRNSVVSFSFSK